MGGSCALRLGMKHPEVYVYSNPALTHKLNEFGIAHEAEEYNGTSGEKNRLNHGRIYDEVLTFFQRHLVFDAK